MFGEDLSRILDLGDPEEMARRLDELDRKMEQAQASYEQLEHDTLHWIGFYNEERLHEELGDVPPAEYELISSRRDTIETLST